MFFLAQDVGTTSTDEAVTAATDATNNAADAANNAADQTPSLEAAINDPQQAVDLVQQYAVPAITALVILIVGYFIASWVGRLVSGGLRKSKIDETLALFFGKLAKVAVMPSDDLSLAALEVPAWGQIGIDDLDLDVISPRCPDHQPRRRHRRCGLRHRPGHAGDAVQFQQRRHAPNL